VTFKIPAFHVKITNTQTGAVVVDKTLADGPTDDARSLVEHTYGADWERVRVRQKTFAGDAKVIFRYQGAAGLVTQELDAKPGTPVDVQKPNGARFRVDVLTVDEAQWKTGVALAFKPPKVSIVGDGKGWRVTFEPQQRPCVCTIAPEVGIKPAGLPIVPFTQGSGHTSASLYVTKGEFGFDDGALVRLGVRGTGMSVRVKLPSGTSAIDVAPETFEPQDAPNASMLEDQYAIEKLQEWAALIGQRVTYR
jgi:hypothetical protein